MFLVVEIQMTDANTMNYLVTVHNTLPDAQSKYFLILSYAAVSELWKHSAAILDGNGKCLASSSLNLDSKRTRIERPSQVAQQQTQAAD